MDGMTMMLSRLLGMKPEEMKAQMEQAFALMRTGADAAAKMQSDINAIKKHLGIEEISQEVIENGGRAIAERGNSHSNQHIQL